MNKQFLRFLLTWCAFAAYMITVSNILNIRYGGLIIFVLTLFLYFALNKRLSGLYKNNSQFTFILFISSLVMIVWAYQRGLKYGTGLGVQQDIPAWLAYGWNFQATVWLFWFFIFRLIYLKYLKKSDDENESTGFSE